MPASSSASTTSGTDKNAPSTAAGTSKAPAKSKTPKRSITSKMLGTEDAKAKPEEEKAVQGGKASLVPFSYYWLKDLIRSFVSQKNFPDALALAFTLASVSIAFPFLPIPIVIVLLIITFALAMYHPLIGLMALFFETLPMLMYQAPLIAWIFTIFVSVSLFLGYKYYRTITFTYMLIMLPLSFLGAVLEIPAFVLAVLVLGLRRGVVLAAVAVIFVVVFTGLTGIQNVAGIAYNATAGHNLIALSPAAQYLVPNKPSPGLANISSAWNTAIGQFLNFKVSAQIGTGFEAAGAVLSYDLPATLVQLALWLITVFVISNHALKSRSGYKGAEASVFGAIVPAGYVALSFVSRSPISIIPIISFLVTPVAIFVLEFSNVDLVKGLEVMKQDFLGKFGEAFEDLSSGTKETLDDVANYDETKKELREALVAPIEHREISGAYGVKPAKGILLFGPPGTGKTLIMRALANDLRAGFFYVKTSSILSPYAGESSQALSKVFATAKKHHPAILFFDEIDSIAGSREFAESESGRHILATMLAEMDGFQKTEGVVIVGATNVPNLVDSAMMRPGRFDKIIYMPLPDVKGREKIFKTYLKKLPIATDIDCKKLAELSNRFSGADIKAVCDEVARQVADVALSKSQMLQITMQDVVKVLKVTKASTSLAQLEVYNTFKLDYERRTHPEKVAQSENAVALDDVIGLKDAKKALYEAVEIPILHPELIKKYDVQNIKGILLFGPPGTGKTMLMQAIAHELGDVHLVTMSGADVSKAGLERALITIRQTFDRAKENAPAILFIDEIDSLVASRENATQFNVQVTGEFLQELDGIRDSSGIVLVGTTNRPDALDAAILRSGRFDKLIFIPPPDKDDRQKIFALNLQKAPVAPNLDYARLADITSGYTGADIANICKQAKLAALEETLQSGAESVITMDTLQKILQKMRPSAPGLVLGRYLAFLSKYGNR